ncbi:hypothetical protein [Flavobacterium sp. W22_SRS_FP1]|uniref:hypothetical protein n=1 Tax=Flavobacterium sp. W22_SRS_FP1 TaxID=3240276 RepID=UPI003F91C9F5
MSNAFTTGKEIQNTDFAFGQLSSYDYQSDLFFMCKDTGLKAIIGIHNRVMGLALGGARMDNYTCELAS